MKVSSNKRIKNFLFLTSLFFISSLNADSFKYNQYNNHGEVGLINTPTARTFDEAVHGITIYNGNPDQKITFTSNPYDWFEASFFIPIFKIGHTAVQQGLNFVNRTIKIKALMQKLDLKNRDIYQL